MSWLRLAVLLAALTGLAWGANLLLLATSVGAGYAAHVLCSLVYVSGQPVQESFDHYVAPEIRPLGPALGFTVADDAVSTRVLGIPRARAVYRRGAGCTQLYAAGPRPDAPAPGSAAPLDASVAWPLGAAAPASAPPPAIAAAIDRAFAEPATGGPPTRQTRAVLIARDGALVAERYAPGTDAETPLVSWSMAKSVLAALYGIASGAGHVSLDAPPGLEAWSGPNDPRRAITVDQLLRMSSGLVFDERYGATNDASVMLFTRPDVAAFAAAMPLDAPPDRVWSYSSGTANILARHLVRALDSRDALRGFAERHLFAPIGIRGAVIEADAAGTPILSSLVFMTGRDWARFGELHRRGGVWEGQRVLPEGWTDYVTTPTPASHGEYGAHWWLNRGRHDAPDTPVWPRLPRDTYAARGHSGQYVVVVPSERLVVVRLGLSVPGADHGIEPLVADVVAHYRDHTSR